MTTFRGNYSCYCNFLSASCLGSKRRGDCKTLLINKSRIVHTPWSPFSSNDIGTSPFSRNGPFVSICRKLPMPQYKSAGPAPCLLLVSTSLPNRQLSNLKRVKIGLNNICWHIIFALFSQHKFTSFLWCFDYCTLIEALFFGSQDIFDKL